MQENGNWEKLNEVSQFEEPVVVLRIGETISIKGEEFYVRKITKKDVILRSVRTRKKKREE